MAAKKTSGKRGKRSQKQQRARGYKTRDYLAGEVESLTIANKNLRHELSQLRATGIIRNMQHNMFFAQYLWNLISGFVQGEHQNDSDERNAVVLDMDNEHVVDIQQCIDELKDAYDSTKDIRKRASSLGVDERMTPTEFDRLVIALSGTGALLSKIEDRMDAAFRSVHEAFHDMKNQHFNDCQHLLRNIDAANRREDSVVKRMHKMLDAEQVVELLDAMKAKHTEPPHEIEMSFPDSTE